MTSIALYVLISAMVGVAAVACWDLPSSDEQRRTSARIALTCWAWPVWAIVGLALLVLGLLEDALDAAEERAEANGYAAMAGERERCACGDPYCGEVEEWPQWLRVLRDWDGTKPLDFGGAYLPQHMADLIERAFFAGGDS